MAAFFGIALGLAAPAALTPSTVRADAIADLAAARAELESYSLDGERTFEVLRRLDTLIEQNAGEASREARVLRALVATDLLVVSRLDPHHADFEARVAQLFETSPHVLVGDLIGELAAIRSGIYRGVAQDALDALALLDQVDIPIPIDWSQHHGVRRDLLMLRAVATEAAEVGAVFDPCVHASHCPEPWASWDAPTRARIAALLEASEAAVRLHIAEGHGDPLVRSLTENVAAYSQRIEGMQIDPAVWLADDPTVLAAESGDRPIRVDRLLVVGREQLRALHAPPVAVREGHVVSLDASEAPEAGLFRASYPVAVTSLDEALRIGLGTMVRGAALAITSTSDARCDSVWRVLSEAHRSGVASVALIRRADDGSLVGKQVLLVEESSVERGDVVVRVRPGFFALERGDSSSMMERSRGDEGLASDLAELQRRVYTGFTRRVLVTFAGDARAADVVRVTLALARQPSPVALAVR